VGEQAEGIVFTVYEEPETRKREEFASAIRERFGSDPGPFSAGFYDNTLLVLEALSESNGDIDAARDWLYDVRDWEGATGLTTFDENGDPLGKSYTVYTVRNGEFVPYAG
jgi:branched-chain amino acid transport system substrate-binding protein